MNALRPFLAMYKAHWGRLSLGILLALITLVASIGLLSLSGWFIAASAVAGLVITSSKEFNYMMPAGGVRFLSVTRTAARWAERVVSHDATFRLLASIRSLVFQRLGPLSRRQTAHLRDGDLLNRMVSDVDALDHLYLRLVSPLVAAVLVVVIMAVFMGQLHADLGWLMAACLGLLLISLPLGFYYAGRTPGEQIGNLQRQLRLDLVNHLRAHAELTVFGGLQTSRQSLADSEQHYLAAQRTMAKLAGLAQALMTALTGWIMLLMLWFADQVLQSSPSPLFALVVFATLASFEALAPLTQAFQHLGHTRSAAQRLLPLVNTKPETRYGNAEPGCSGLEIRKLGFTYPGSDTAILQDLNLSIESGEKVALLGTTGCGKSTLLDLIGRHLAADSGTIEIDGVPLEDLSQQALRRGICHISQRVHVFNDTLANNLRLAKPDASDEELSDALSKVGMDTMAKQLGLDGWLGEGGRQLSGGEIRRLGLARALLHPANIILLDEITEGLDRENEAKVLDLLFEHRPERTVLMVSHRTTGLERMDRVLVMEDGRLTRQ